VVTKSIAYVLDPTPIGVVTPRRFTRRRADHGSNRFNEVRAVKPGNTLAIVPIEVLTPWLQ